MEWDSYTREVLASFAARESEETWNAMDDALAKLKGALRDVDASGNTLSRPDHLVQALKKIQQPVVAALSSERSKLSRTSLELIEVAATLLERDFEPLAEAFIPSTLALCSRANRVFVTAATSCIHSVIRISWIPRMIPTFFEALKSKNKTMRSCAAEATLVCLQATPSSLLADHQTVIENTIRAAIEDSNSTVRETARAMYSEYSKCFPERIGSLHQSLQPTAKKYLNLTAPREQPARLNVRTLRSAFQASHPDGIPSVDVLPVTPPEKGPHRTGPSQPTHQDGQQVLPPTSTRRTRPTAPDAEGTELVPKTPLHCVLGSAMRRPRAAPAGGAEFEPEQAHGERLASARRVRPAQSVSEVGVSTGTVAAEGFEAAVGGAPPSLPGDGADKPPGIAGVLAGSMPVFKARKIGGAGAQRVAVPPKPDDAPLPKLASEARRPAKHIGQAPEIQQSVEEPPKVKDLPVPVSTSKVEVPAVEHSEVESSRPAPEKRVERDVIKKPSAPTASQAAAQTNKDKSRIPIRAPNSTFDGPSSGSSSSWDFAQLTLQSRSPDWSVRHRAFAALAAHTRSAPPSDMDRHAPRVAELLVTGLSDTHFKVLKEALDGATAIVERAEKVREYAEQFLPRALAVSRNVQFKGKTAALHAANGVVEAVEGRLGTEEMVAVVVACLGQPDVAKGGRVRAALVELLQVAVEKAPGYLGSHTRFLVTRLAPFASDLDLAFRDAARAVLLAGLRANAEAFFAGVTQLATQHRRAVRMALVKEVPDWDRMEREFGVGEVQKGAVSKSASSEMHGSASHESLPVQEVVAVETTVVENPETTPKASKLVKSSPSASRLSGFRPPAAQLLARVTPAKASPRVDTPASPQLTVTPSAGGGSSSRTPQGILATKIPTPKSATPKVGLVPEQSISRTTTLAGQSLPPSRTPSAVSPLTSSQDSQTVSSRTPATQLPSASRASRLPVFRSPITPTVVPPITSASPVSRNAPPTPSATKPSHAPPSSSFHQESALDMLADLAMDARLSTSRLQEVSTDGLLAFEESVDLIGRVELDLVGNSTGDASVFNRSSHSLVIADDHSLVLDQPAPIVFEDAELYAAEQNRAETDAVTGTVDDTQLGTTFWPAKSDDSLAPQEAAQASDADNVDMGLEARFTNWSSQETLGEAPDMFVQEVDELVTSDVVGVVSSPTRGSDRRQTTGSQSLVPTPKVRNVSGVESALGSWSPLKPRSTGRRQEDQVDALRFQQEELEKQIHSLNEELYSLRRENSGLAARYEEEIAGLRQVLHEEKSIAASRVSELTITLSLLQNEVDALRNHNQQREAESDQFRSENQGLKRNATMWANQLAKQSDEIQSLRNQLADADKLNVSLSESLGKAKADLQSARAETRAALPAGSVDSPASKHITASRYQADFENQTQQLRMLKHDHDAKLAVFVDACNSVDLQSLERAPLAQVPDLNRVLSSGEPGTVRAEAYWNAVLKAVETPASAHKASRSRILASTPLRASLG